MPRVSTKENKNIYQQIRERLGLSREAASERLAGVSADKIEKIESEKTVPYPDEVLAMSRGYNAPTLCNHYCSKQCPIGMEYVPEIKLKELSQIVLEMVASLNAVEGEKNKLIELAADGEISDKEIDEFIHIQGELERISVAVETLQLWTEKMLASGVIDKEKYNSRKK